MKKEAKYTLQLTFENISKKYFGKTIYIGFWKENYLDFPKDGTIDFGEMLVIDTENPKIILTLKPGVYALSAFIDTNENGKLDKNFIGIPKEPYCFSNNFTPLFTAPEFADCSFNFQKNECFVLKMIA